MLNRASILVVVTCACIGAHGCSDPSSPGATGGYDAGCSPSRDANSALAAARLKAGAPTECPSSPPLALDCSWRDASETGGFDCTSLFRGTDGGQCKGKYAGAEIGVYAVYDVHKDRSVCGFFNVGGIVPGKSCDYDLPCR